VAVAYFTFEVRRDDHATAPDGSVRLAWGTGRGGCRARAQKPVVGLHQRAEHPAREHLRTHTGGVREVGLAQTAAYAGGHGAVPSHGLDGVEECATHRLGGLALFCDQHRYHPHAHQRIAFLARAIHGAQHQAARARERALALLQHRHHGLVVFVHGVGEAVAALVGTELVDEQIRLSPAQLFRPVFVVLLVVEANARALYPESIQHHARHLSLQHDTKHARGAALGHDFELVLAVGNLDDCVAHLLLVGPRIDLGVKLAIHVDAETTGRDILHVDHDE